jgi:3-isopropylmalate dehydratase small subunit
MSGRVNLAGPVFTIDANVDTDTIIKSRHCTSADPNALAPHCLAELGGTSPFRPGAYPLLLCRGTFGIGSARIQAPLALAGAGVKAVIARAFAPIFFENCINGALLLPFAADLGAWPVSGTHMEVAVSDGRLSLSWDSGRASLACGLPDWALAGRSWMDIIEEQARAAGGLEALRARRLSPR